MTVPLNGTAVAEGDQLGFYIAEATIQAGPGEGSTNLVPFCHLEYDIGAPNGPAAPAGQVAFQQGSGQNSLRGLQANMSPISERVGRGVKFFTTVH